MTAGTDTTTPRDAWLVRRLTLRRKGTVLTWSAVVVNTTAKLYIPMAGRIAGSCGGAMTTVIAIITFVRWTTIVRAEHKVIGELAPITTAAEPAYRTASGIRALAILRIGSVGWVARRCRRRARRRRWCWRRRISGTCAGRVYLFVMTRDSVAIKRNIAFESTCFARRGGGYTAVAGELVCSVTKYLRLRIINIARA